TVTLADRAAPAEEFPAPPESAAGTVTRTTRRRAVRPDTRTASRRASFIFSVRRRPHSGHRARAQRISARLVPPDNAANNAVAETRKVAQSERRPAVKRREAAGKATRGWSGGDRDRARR